LAPPIPKICGFLLIHRTLPISRVRIAATIVLAQLKGHERIGKAQITLRRAFSIVLYNSPIDFAVVTRNGNMFNMR
jgi:hypothetical protein